MKVQIRDIGADELHQMLRPRPADGHKGTFGHALLVAGSRGMAGAAILAAEACLRSGVGKLSIATAEANRPLLQVAVPEAIVRQDDHLDGFQAIGLGPGLGLNAPLVGRVLSEGQAPLVVDADGLNTLATHPDMLPLLPPDTVLTPHPGEAVRLMGSAEVERAAAFARQWGVLVVLKGHPTHVLTPRDEALRLRVGNSGMATAGSGDVLTGLITGLLAQGYPPREAALLGVWLHGRAGDHAAHELTEHCLLARDIVHHLPEAFGELKIKNEKLKIKS